MASSIVGQLSLFDVTTTTEKYCYVAPKGKWIKPCVSCNNWKFSFKGVRCEYPNCLKNNNADYNPMIKKEVENDRY